MSCRTSHPMNLTLTAFYNQKPDHFAEFIRWCQTAVLEHIPGAFIPYELGQVHATIIGLESIHKDGEVLNANYKELDEDRIMDLAGMLAFLNTTPLLPFQVRIGGFRPGEPVPFKSRGEHPYLRTFAIRETNIVVAMGWPEIDGEFPENLDRLRWGFNPYNIIHKYHKRAESVDNDLFFVLGKVDPDSVRKITRQAVSEQIRARIAGMEPLRIDLSLEDLSLVAYINNELPLATSLQISLQDARHDLEGLKDLCKQAK